MPANTEFAPVNTTVSHVAELATKAASHRKRSGSGGTQPSEEEGVWLDWRGDSYQREELEGGRTENPADPEGDR